jgi:hypothetical protein
MTFGEVLAALIKGSRSLNKNSRLQQASLANRKVKNWRDLVLNKTCRPARSQETNALARHDAARPYRSLWRSYHD